MTAIDNTFQTCTWIRLKRQDRLRAQVILIVILTHSSVIIGTSCWRMALSMNSFSMTTTSFIGATTIVYRNVLTLSLLKVLNIYTLLCYSAILNKPGFIEPRITNHMPQFGTAIFQICVFLKTLLYLMAGSHWAIYCFRL